MIGSIDYVYKLNKTKMAIILILLIYMIHMRYKEINIIGNMII